MALALVQGYAFAWIGHFFFEHNKPATFKYPRFSFMGDWRLWWDIVTGKIPYQRELGRRVGQRLTFRFRGRRPGWSRIPVRTTGDEDLMNTTRLIAIALIVAGILGLVYGGFSYTKDTTAVKLGPLELSVKQKETINVPMWAGIGAIVVGGLLLVLGSRKG